MPFYLKRFFLFGLSFVLALQEFQIHANETCSDAYAQIRRELRSDVLDLEAPAVEQAVGEEVTRLGQLLKNDPTQIEELGPRDEKFLNKIFGKSCLFASYAKNTIAFSTAKTVRTYLYKNASIALLGTVLSDVSRMNNDDFRPSYDLLATIVVLQLMSNEVSCRNRMREEGAGQGGSSPNTTYWQKVEQSTRAYSKLVVPGVGVYVGFAVAQDKYSGRELRPAHEYASTGLYVMVWDAGIYGMHALFLDKLFLKTVPHLRTQMASGIQKILVNGKEKIGNMMILGLKGNDVPGFLLEMTGLVYYRKVRGDLFTEGKNKFNEYGSETVDLLADTFYKAFYSKEMLSDPVLKEKVTEQFKIPQSGVSP